MTEKIAIGVIRTSHGVRGEVKVHSFSGETDHFLRLRRVELRSSGGDRVVPDLAIESIKAHSNSLIVKFAEVETPEQARTYNGFLVYVDKKEAAKKRRDEYYAAELCGVRVVYGGDERGTVTSTWENGDVTMLDVETIDGRTVIVPFIKRFVGPVNVRARTMELFEDWILE